MPLIGYTSDMAELKTKPNRASVAAFLKGVEDEGRRKDCRAVMAMMKEIIRIVDEEARRTQNREVLSVSEVAGRHRPRCVAPIDRKVGGGHGADV